MIDVTPAILSYPDILAGNGLNVDERLKAARERREEQLKQLGMWAHICWYYSHGIDNIYMHKNLFVMLYSSTASRELSRIEREQRAKRYYERQLQERRKKLLEQRLKEERRRAAVEEKRKQRLKEERVSFDGGYRAFYFQRCR